MELEEALERSEELYADAAVDVPDAEEGGMGLPVRSECLTGDVFVRTGYPSFVILWRGGICRYVNIRKIEQGRNGYSSG